jgi:hypothetical protein
LSPAHDSLAVPSSARRNARHRLPTYIDAIQEIAADTASQVETKVRGTTTEYHKRVWVRTAGGSYLLVLTSQQADALRFKERETRETTT